MFVRVRNWNGGDRMLFSKNGRKKSGQVWHNEKSLRPILHVMDSLKDYHKELTRKEVESLSELSLVGSSFAGVLARRIIFRLSWRSSDNHFPVSMRPQVSLPR